MISNAAYTGSGVEIDLEVLQLPAVLMLVDRLSLVSLGRARAYVRTRTLSLNRDRRRERRFLAANGFRF